MSEPLDPQLGRYIVQELNTKAAPPSTAFLAKLALVAQDCHYIKKDAKNEFHRYSYTSAKAVLEKISIALATHGLVSWTESWVDRIITKDRLTSKGEKSVDYIAVCGLHLHIRSVEDGTGIRVTAHGAGQDVGDKAVMKGQTAAIKYCWLLALNVATGDDPEKDRSVDERNAGEDGGGRARATTKKGKQQYQETKVSEELRAAEAWLKEHPEDCVCEEPMVARSTADRVYVTCEYVAKSFAEAKDQAQKDLVREVAKKHSFRWWKAKGGADGPGSAGEGPATAGA